MRKLSYFGEKNILLCISFNFTGDCHSQNLDLSWTFQRTTHRTYFLLKGPKILCFDFKVSPSKRMWTSGRMSNAKNLLGLGISLYFWGLMDLTTTVLSGSARPLTEGQEDNLSDKLHQRMKRSWVWNQFFVLEEYTGTDPLYVGKVRPTPGGRVYTSVYLQTMVKHGQFPKHPYLLSGSEFIHINFTLLPRAFDQCHLRLGRISLPRGCQYICLFQRDLLHQSSFVIEAVLENL